MRRRSPGKPVVAKRVLAHGIFASLVLANVALPGAGPAAAQDLGVPFGRPARRAVRNPAHRPARTAIPLPVPRPRFPDDAAAEPPSIVATPPGTSRAVQDESPGKSTGKDGAGKALEGLGAPPMEPGRPAVAPSGADTTFDPRQPAADEACPGRLAAGRVAAEPVTIGRQPDARCTVVQPVRLSDVTLVDGLKVAFPDHPTVACETADTFARYVRELLVPLAKGSYGLAVDAVWTGPGLECRSRDHVFGAKLSAHGQGLAIDIAQLELADGRRIEVGAPRTVTDQAFETAARAAACGYFHTTLGPGSDSYHRSHWHFDLEQRGKAGDGKYCK